MTGGRSEEPQAIFGQPELPLEGVEPLDPIRRVELWLATQPEDFADLDGFSARLYLDDSDTRLQRAKRWFEIQEIDARCTYKWGVLLHGGTETSWLLGEAAHGLVQGLWLSSLLCSHAACERHLAGILAFDEHSLPNSWRGWGLGRLVQAAQQRGIVPSDLWEPLGTLNEVRKVSAHFKPPLHGGSLMNRAQAVEDSNLLRSALELAEADAFAAYETARSLVLRASWP